MYLKLKSVRAFWIALSCQCLYDWKISTFNDCIQCIRWEINEYERIWLLLVSFKNSAISWLSWLFINRSFYSEYDLTLICLMKCFRNSISITLFVKSCSDVIMIAFRFILKENQFNIRYFSCIITREDDGILPAASIVSMTVRDHRSSGLKK